MSWKDNAEKYKAFQTAARVYALETKMLEPGQENGEAYDELESTFVMLRGSLDTFTTPEQAMTAFHTWLVESKDAAKRTDNPIRVGCEISHNYGARTVTFSYHEIFEIATPFQRDWAFKEVRRIVDAAHADYARTVGQAPQQQQQQPTTGGEVDIFDATILSVKVENGKTSFKVHGGRWVKFGVPIYPEVMREAFPDLNGIPPTGLSLTGRKAHAIMSNGKPVKIIKIE